jgi:hypothetical protein
MCQECTGRTGGIAQLVESLLCKCEAMSSNPTPTKKKKEYIAAQLPFLNSKSLFTITWRLYGVGLRKDCAVTLDIDLSPYLGSQCPHV